MAFPEEPIHKENFGALITTIAEKAILSQRVILQRFLKKVRFGRDFFI